MFAAVEDRDLPTRSKIFISYRRETAAGYACLLYDRLNAHFPGAVFIDVSSMEIGEDFVDRIKTAVSRCDVLVALIDKQWISIADDTGMRRLDDPQDFLRLEIATALSRRIRVVPMLLNGAPMPEVEELPDDLAALTRRHALQISDVDLDQNIGRLIQLLKRQVESASAIRKETDHVPPVGITNAPGAYSKRLVGLVIGLIAFCLCLQIVGSNKTMGDYFIHTFGFQTTRTLAIRVLVFSVLTYIVGFGVLFRYVREIPKSWLVFGASLLVGITLWINLGPHGWPTPERSLEPLPPIWAERVFDNQNPNGGIRLVIRSPETREQVFTTAQCLKGVLMNRQISSRYATSIRSAFNFISSNRRTRPQEGWGYMVNSQRTITDISAWVALAYIESLNDDIWLSQDQQQVFRAIDNELRFLSDRQDISGGWTPIAERNRNFTRTYSSAIALWAFIEAERLPVLRQLFGARYNLQKRRGIQWLLSTYDPETGWDPNPNRKDRESFPGLTAQVLFILSRAEAGDPELGSEQTLRIAKSAFLTRRWPEKLPFESSSRDSDMNVSFDTEDGFTAEAVRFLWYPWALAESLNLSRDQGLSEHQRNMARRDLNLLLAHGEDINRSLDTGPTYVLAENLIATSYVINSIAR